MHQNAPAVLLSKHLPYTHIPEQVYTLPASMNPITHEHNTHFYTFFNKAAQFLVGIDQNTQNLNEKAKYTTNTHQLMV